ncbi:hypothetical protein L9X50_00045 [Vibrio aestuarianus]|uniref:hypothetical protein n=1 Tax=Vibrio aestuarianus TaxID=28171 RepID=UPI0021C28636|nr:hypothetical protein [Vibrio aestuarianus]MDE1316404.1 hypothetical protein [Vibrio aestuarianus]
MTLFITIVLYPSDLKLQRCWLRSLTPHRLSMLMGMNSLVAYLQLQVVWAYHPNQ